MMTEIFAALLYSMTGKSYIAFCDVSLNKDAKQGVYFMVYFTNLICAFSKQHAANLGL